MAPAGRQGHPKVTIGTPKGDIVKWYMYQIFVQDS